MLAILQWALTIIGALVVLLAAIVAIACCVMGGKWDEEFQDNYWTDKDD